MDISLLDVLMHHANEKQPVTTTRRRHGLLLNVAVATGQAAKVLIANPTTGANQLIETGSLTVSAGTLAAQQPASLGTAAAAGKVVVLDSNGFLPAAVVPGGGGGGSSYTHVQAVAALTWTINHGLGVRPVVALFNTSGEQFVGDISHPDGNTTIVTLTVALAGSAQLVS